jgi:ubiquinone/menaquinone biosynthesis C-methylase UbiE
MVFYSTYIFPRLFEWSLGRATVLEQRRATLAPLAGRVLEIGFGTGLNLSAYPSTVSRLIALDIESFLPGRVASRIAASKLDVEQVHLDAGGHLPFEDDSFDGVVTTFTLCSIDEVGPALNEIRRVLKPMGDYVFLEHGRSSDSKIARKQDRYNPITKLIGCGCNMNRSIDALVEDSGLQIRKLDRLVLADSPRIVGELYRGLAHKSD